jgi:hypothetical protein
MRTSQVQLYLAPFSQIWKYRFCTGLRKKPSLLAFIAKKQHENMAPFH